MTTAGLPPHPGLRIRVYTVDPGTLKRTGEYIRTTLEPSGQTMTTWAWPPCLCPRHRPALPQENCGYTAPEPR